MCVRVCLCSLQRVDEPGYGTPHCVREESRIGAPEVENPFWSFEGKRYTLRIALEASFVPWAGKVVL